MPAKKSAPRATDVTMIERYGLSFAALEILRERFPKQSLAILSKTFGKFFMRAESRAEFLWAQQAPPMLERVFASEIVWSARTPFSFHIPGASYKPDFGHLLKDGRMVFVEVKASTFQPSYRDSRGKLRSAATLYPMFEWYQATMEKSAPDGWLLEKIEPDPDFQQWIINFAMIASGN